MLTHASTYSALSNLSSRPDRYWTLMLTFSSVSQTRRHLFHTRGGGDDINPSPCQEKKMRISSWSLHQRLSQHVFCRRRVGLNGAETPHGLSSVGIGCTYINTLPPARLSQRGGWVSGCQVKEGIECTECCCVNWQKSPLFHLKCCASGRHGKNTHRLAARTLTQVSRNLSAVRFHFHCVWTNSLAKYARYLIRVLNVINGQSGALVNQS